MLLLLAGCSGGGEPGPMLGDGSNLLPAPSGGCAVGTEGCACSVEGATVDCGTVEARSGDNVVCLRGKRSCTNGVWGTCAGDQRVQIYAPLGRPGLGAQSLAGSSTSCGNVCDPDCQTFVDTPASLTPGTGLSADAAGLSLTPTGGLGGGTCSNIIISASPSASTLTVTSFSPLATTPASLTFTATCGVGGPTISPTWTISSADSAIASIDSATGVFAAHAGVAKDVTVTALSAIGTATAVAHIKVQIDVDDAGTCATTAIKNQFSTTATGGTDPGLIMYPYPIAARPVVFPLNLTAPLLQWNTGARTATCVKVSLNYPSGSASPTFHWGKLASGEPKQGTLDTTQPAFVIDQTAWANFSTSARAADGDIVLQRRTDNTVSPSSQRLAVMTSNVAKVHFADDALRGTVYYTQYLSRFRSTSCSGSGQTDLTIASYPATSLSTGKLSGTAPVCPVGNCTHPSSTGSSVQSLNLGVAGATPVNAFGASGGCPVCHSVSSDGSTLVATGNLWQTAAGATGTAVGLDSIGSSGTLTGTTDVPQYSFPWGTPPWSFGSEPVEDGRGWAYSAISPTGQYVLQGPNFWGNTVDTLNVNNTQDGGYGAGGKRFLLQDTTLFKPSVKYATRAALPTNVKASTTLTASANAALTVDGVAVANGDAVLVKNETDTTKHGIYTVTNKGSASVKWVLTRRSDADTVNELKNDQRFRVESGAAPTPVYYRIVTAGAITPGTTNLDFAQWTTVRAATTAALPGGTPVLSGSVLTAGANAALTVDNVALVTGMSILVKDQASPNQKHNGVYTITNLGSASAKWVLTRRSDFDESAEVTNGARVQVTEGTTQGGKLYSLSTANPITLNTTDLVFAEVTTDATLRGTSLMTPAFSPDGRHLVYVNGDADTISGSSTGWRRGLSVLDFDPSTLTFSNKRRLVNNFNAATTGNTVKWPFFESDNASVLYVESDATEFCPVAAGTGKCNDATCATTTSTVSVGYDLERACMEATYGNMSPSTRSYWHGRLRSVNVASPATTNVELSYLNDAVDSTDADKSYQPTVLPFAAGGYRWVIFTSQRSYGNQFNAIGTHFSCSSAMLWMAALDDTVAGTSDRSHPAFLVPGQAIRSIIDAANVDHYVNERGYLVPSPCKASGSSCDVSEECCGGSGATPTTSCRIDLPATSPVTRHCVAVSGSCAQANQSCSVDADCCGSTPCIGGQCIAAPTYTPATFTRDYQVTCPQDGYKIVWGDLRWHASALSNSSLSFSAQTSADGNFATATSVPVATVTSANSNAPPAAVLTADVGAKLLAAQIGPRNYLRLTMSFTPSADSLVSPILYDWEQRYTCVPAE